MTRESTHSGGGGMIEGSWPKNWQGGGQGSLSTTVGYRVPTIVTNLSKMYTKYQLELKKKNHCDTEFQPELRAFVSPWNIKLSLRQWTNDRPYIVMICNLVFSALSKIIVRHLISSHLTRHARDKFHAWMVSKTRCKINLTYQSQKPPNLKVVLKR